MVRTLVQLMRTLDRMPEEVKIKLVFIAIMQCSRDFICNDNKLFDFVSVPADHTDETPVL